MMPGKRRSVPVVAASYALASGFIDESDLASESALLLALVSLVAMVGVDVLATAGAEPALSALQAFAADLARQSGFHSVMIV